MSQKKKNQSGKMQLFSRTKEEKKTYIDSKYAMCTDKAELANRRKSKLIEKNEMNAIHLYQKRKNNANGEMEENDASEAHMMNLIKKIQSQMSPEYEKEDFDQIKQSGHDNTERKTAGAGSTNHRGSLLVLQNSLNHTQNLQIQQKLFDNLMEKYN